MSRETNKIVPLTLEELKEPLTPAERDEADNPNFLHQLQLFIEGVNNTTNLNVQRRKCMVEAMR